MGEIKAGDRVIITDARGEEHRVVADSSIEGGWAHSFPVVWVWVDEETRMPWPAESVRAVDG